MRQKPSRTGQQVCLFYEDIDQEQVLLCLHRRLKWGAVMALRVGGGTQKGREIYPDDIEVGTERRGLKAFVHMRFLILVI
jgi:hypothetical protein